MNRLLRSNSLLPWLMSVCLAVIASSQLQAKITDADLAGLTLSKDSDDLKIYLKKGVDLSVYKQLVLTKVDAAFDPKWLDHYNREQRSLSERINERDHDKILKRYIKGFEKTMASTVSNEGKYSLSDTATEKALKIDASIVDLKITAPDKFTATPSNEWVRQAGEATLETRMYDADSGELVLAIIDHRESRDRIELFQTNQAINQYEFSRVYRKWILNWLKAMQGKD